MKRFNSPTSVFLWPGSSSAISAINTNFREQFNFDAEPALIPNELMGVTCVKIDKGIVRSFTEPTIRSSVWADPLEEQDIVLIVSKNTASYQECRDLLNLACPVKTNSIVTFTAQPDANLEGGFRVSVAAALERDLEWLDPNVVLYQGRSIAGSPGVLLGVAAELDQSAFCIMIEYAVDSQFVSSSAISAAMQTFSRITSIDNSQGRMSEQAIRMHKHLKEMAKRTNQDYFDKQANPYAAGEEQFRFGPFESFANELRREENYRWIEQLFDGIGDENGQLDHARTIFLKSELDRLELYDQFEDRFLDLWSKQSSQCDPEY